MMLKRMKKLIAAMAACVMFAGNVMTSYAVTTEGMSDEECEKEFSETFYFYSVIEDKKVTLTKGDALQDYPYPWNYPIFPNAYYLIGENGRISCALICKVDGKYMCTDELGMVVRSRWMPADESMMYFDKNGYALTNQWVYIENKWYYLGSDGKPVKGWAKIGGSWYYMNKDGEMQTGWVFYSNDKTWYYMSKSGAMATGWVKDGNKWYYMDRDGRMHTGWLKDGDKWYYMDSKGAMKTGWLESGNAIYYLKNSGAMASNEKLDVNGVQYTFDASGACVR